MIDEDILMYILVVKVSVSDVDIGFDGWFYYFFCLKMKLFFFVIDFYFGVVMVICLLVGWKK